MRQVRVTFTDEDEGEQLVRWINLPRLPRRGPPPKELLQRALACKHKYRKLIKEDNERTVLPMTAANIQRALACKARYRKPILMPPPEPTASYSLRKTCKTPAGFDIGILGPKGYTYAHRPLCGVRTTRGS